MSLARIVMLALTSIFKIRSFYEYYNELMLTQPNVALFLFSNQLLA